MCGCLSRTQTCALTGNQTGDSLVCRPALNPLSHTPARAYFLSDSLREKRSAPLTKQPGTACFKMSCSSRVENHCSGPSRSQEGESLFSVTRHLQVKGFSTASPQCAPTPVTDSSEVFPSGLNSAAASPAVGSRSAFPKPAGTLAPIPGHSQVSPHPSVSLR